MSTTLIHLLRPSLDLGAVPHRSRLRASFIGQAVETVHRGLGNVLTLGQLECLPLRHAKYVGDVLDTEEFGIVGRRRDSG
jgi:hypothetical protein